MTVYAAVMTGKGTGAISTIQVFGDSAEALIKKIFRPTVAGPARFKSGQILLGTIADGNKTIDQVTIGCEGPKTFAINCHGNPLIVEMIMQLLRRCGAELLTAEQLLTKILSAQKSVGTIAVEAKLAELKAKTIEGTKIIANQVAGGLGKKAHDWLRTINEIPLAEIKAEAARILQKSEAAKLIIYGCIAALIGPPNSGKSTLLNYLAGRQKAIVTDIKGTTRDWVEATCRMDPLSLTLIDTAGLDEKPPAPQNTIDKAAQKRSVQILRQADLLLLVLDNSQAAEQVDRRLLEIITGKKVITVLNKSDLPAKFDIGTLPKTLSDTVRTSAKEGIGMEDLAERIRQISGVASFDLQTAVCFTSRQQDLLKQLHDAKSNATLRSTSLRSTRQQATLIITELLNTQTWGGPWP